MSDTPRVTPVIHIVGPTITIGPYRRCRCAWCGAVIEDVDLRTIALPIDKESDVPPSLPEWPMWALLMVDGNVRAVVEHNDGDKLPDGSCGLLDPEVTA